MGEKSKKIRDVNVIVEKLKEKPLRFFQLLFPDRTSIVIFLLAFSLLLTFWQVGLLLNDEWVSANQLTNLKNGSLTVDVIKYGSDRGIYNVSGRPIGAYTHALPFFALPVYYALSAVAHLVNLRLFFMLLWLVSVFTLLYYCQLGGTTKKTKYVLVILTMLFFSVNVLLYLYPALDKQYSFLYTPLDFARWGEVIALNFLNIVATSIVILIIYRLFNQIFVNEKIGFIAALTVLIGTPFSVWALTGKDHSLSLLFITLGLFLFYHYATNSISNPLNTNQRHHKYLAFSMIGLAVWVRAEAAVPLFFALFLSEVLYVYRTNTARQQILNIIKIVVVIALSLTPFFINNYLLFENIFFPPMKASTDVIIAGSTKINETAPVATQIQVRTVLILESASKIPHIFETMFMHYQEIPRNFLPLFFHNDNPTLMSIFEICPLLMFSMLMLYRFLLILIRRNAGAIIKREYYLHFLFFVFIIVHIMIYSEQTSTNLAIGQWDPRYFLPIYVPMLFFSISFLRDYGVFDKLKEITTTLVSCISMLTPSLIFAFVVFGNRDFYNLFMLCEILAWIAIVILAGSFIHMLIKKNERSKKLFAYAIGFSLFSTFFWLFNFGFMFGKCPSAGFVLPAMTHLHGQMAYHTGIVFSMKKVIPITWT